MSDKLKIMFLILGIIVFYMWILELGPFEKKYPPSNIDSGYYEPSFTGRNGPCGYNNHNCPYKCNDWRVPAGGGSRCGNCGHDMMVHSLNNLSY